MAYTGWTVSIKIYPLIHFSNRNDPALSQSSNYAYSCSPPHILSSSSYLCPCPSTSAFLHADIQSSTSLRSTCLYHLCLPRINSRSTNVKPIFTNYYTPIKYTSIQVSTRTFSCIFVVDVRPASSVPGRASLRSSTVSTLLVPRVYTRSFGMRGFFHACPSTWNFRFIWEGLNSILVHSRDS